MIDLKNSFLGSRILKHFIVKHLWKACTKFTNHLFKSMLMRDVESVVSSERNIQIP